MFKRLSKTFTILGLRYNYRSYQEIINFAGTVYNRVQENYLSRGIQSATISTIRKIEPINVKCVRGIGANIWTMNRFGQMLNVITGSQVDPKTTIDNFLMKRPMILCRTNKQVKAFEEIG